MTPTPDPFAARDALQAGGRDHAVYRLEAVRDDLGRTPFTIKVLLESVLRNCGRGFVTQEDVRALAGWRPNSGSTAELPFLPARGDAGLHRGPVRRRPRRDARRHGRSAATRT